MKIRYNALIQYFDLDNDNCLLTREDFCNVITDFINDPEKLRNIYLDELKTWINDRAEPEWWISEPIETHDEVFKFWNLNSEETGLEEGE
jgi:hypothetical protein|tara:strand:- start:653 stop:922 length:270 start_codon:yes stop_codon:yes gene_type:complete